MGCCARFLNNLFWGAERSEGCLGVGGGVGRGGGGVFRRSAGVRVVGGAWVGGARMPRSWVQDARRPRSGRVPPIGGLFRPSEGETGGILLGAATITAVLLHKSGAAPLLLCNRTRGYRRPPTLLLPTDGL